MENSPATPRKIAEPAPIARLIGFQPRSIELDRAVIELEAGSQHWNPLGTVHGGVYCDLADYAMGTSWLTGVPEGETFTTIEMKINFLRPFRTGKLIAQATVIQRGRSIGLVECEVRDEQGRLIAKASSTCMVLRGEQATGR